MASTASRTHIFLALVAAAGLVGCGGDGGGGGPIDPDFDLAVVVEGTALDLLEQPIFGVTIRITAYVWTASAGCTTELVGPPATTTVTEEGTFSRTVGFEGSTEDEIEACLTVEALPPLGYFPDTRSNIRTEIRPLSQGVEVVQVELVLEPTLP